MKKLLFGAIGVILSFFPSPSMAGQCPRGQYWQTTTSSCASCGAHATSCIEMLLEAEHCMNTTGKDISLPTALSCENGYYNQGYNTGEDFTNCNGKMTASRATRQRCESCPAGCSKCWGKNGCTACYSGYTLQYNEKTKNGKCIPANCAEWDNSGICTKCNSGYVLKNGICNISPVISCPDDMQLSADGCCCIPQ